MEGAFKKAQQAHVAKTCSAYDEAARALRDALEQETDPGRRRGAQHMLDLIERARESVPAAAPAKWDDVIGQDGAKEALREALVLPALHPELFVGARRPWRSILLWGPPGTGKTLLARAAASASGASFHAATPADLLSKWVGESEGAVRGLFDRLRAARPAVLFVDEIEALCRRRGDEQHETSARVLSQFLTELDGVRADANEGVFVLAATNHPELLDPAMLRRFECRIYVGLPDARDRAAMVRQMLGATPHALGEDDLAWIVERTACFSGADVHAVVRAAAMGPVRELARAAWFRRDDAAWTACDEGGDGATAMVLADVPRGMALARPVARRDFEAALATARPATTEEMLRKYQEFEKM